MNIVMMGPQGSGKGTQSRKLKENYNMKYIEMGFLLRKFAQKNSELGEEIDEIIDRGDLVPTDMLMKVLSEELENVNKDVILDGVPRNLEQARELEKIVDIDRVIYLDIPKEISIKRLSNRRQCRECGKIYNKITKPPENEGICDECGGELYQREDDKPKVIKNRLETFNEETKPLLEYYRKKGILKKIDGMGSIEEVYKKLKM